MAALFICLFYALFKLIKLIAGEKLSKRYAKPVANEFYSHQLWVIAFAVKYVLYAAGRNGAQVCQSVYAYSAFPADTVIAAGRYRQPGHRSSGEGRPEGYRC